MPYKIPRCILLTSKKSLDVITKTKGLFFKYMEISKAIHKITMFAVHTNYGTR